MGKKRKKKHNNNEKFNKKNNDSQLFKKWLREHDDIPDKDKGESLSGEGYRPFENLDKNEFKKNNKSNKKNKFFKKDKNNNNRKFDNDENSNIQDDKYFDDDPELFFKWLGEDQKIKNKDNKNNEEDDSYKKPFLKKKKELKKNIKPQYKDYHKFYVEDQDMLEKWLKKNDVIDKDNMIKEEEIRMYPPEYINSVRIDSTIDLHGLKVHDAIFQLKIFIKECFDKNEKVVRVIHGKGIHSTQGPKIKKAVKDWLIHEGKTYIRLFKTASPKHGGTGAVIIWLK